MIFLLKGWFHIFYKGNNFGFNLISEQKKFSDQQSAHEVFIIEKKKEMGVDSEMLKFTDKLTKYLFDTIFYTYHYRPHK